MEQKQEDEEEKEKEKEKEQDLNEAVEAGDIQRVKHILDHSPNIDLSWSDNNLFALTALQKSCQLGNDEIVFLLLQYCHRSTVGNNLLSNIVNQKTKYSGSGPLLLACEYGHHNIIRILLSVPGIDVNQESNYEQTSFHMSCNKWQILCFLSLFNDSRVNVNKPNKGGYTPLYYISAGGYLNNLMWMISSDRQQCMDLGQPGDYKTDAIRAAKLYGREKVLSLLTQFKEQPHETKHKSRLKIRWYQKCASDMFALVIFVCDDLLQIKQQNTIPNYDKSVRFFTIVKQLPMDLQMVLCNRYSGSMRTNIITHDSEPAFKGLAQSYVLNSLWSQ